MPCTHLTVMILQGCSTCSKTAPRSRDGRDRFLPGADLVFEKSDRKLKRTGKNAWAKHLHAHLNWNKYSTNIPCGSIPRVLSLRRSTLSPVGLPNPMLNQPWSYNVHNDQKLLRQRSDEDTITLQATSLEASGDAYGTNRASSNERNKISSQFYRKKYLEDASAIRIENVYCNPPRMPPQDLFLGNRQKSCSSLQHFCVCQPSPEGCMTPKFQTFIQDASGG